MSYHPHNKKLTDLPVFAHLRGTPTFDNRLWDDVRGIQHTVGNVIHYAMAEEDLTSIAGKPSGYAQGFVGYHEAGHAVQFSALTQAQKTRLTQLRTTRLAASGAITRTTPSGPATQMWLNPAWYTAANDEEYWAQSVAAFFGQPYSSSPQDTTMYTRTWLQSNDPDMYQLLTQVFQP